MTPDESVPWNRLAKSPRGRGLLTLLSAPVEDIHRLSEDALAEDWLRPEEDEAWVHLQPGR